MLIAIPTDSGKMCGHFGHAPQFSIYRIEGNEVQNKEVLAAPPASARASPRMAERTTSQYRDRR